MRTHPDLATPYPSPPHPGIGWMCGQIRRSSATCGRPDTSLIGVSSRGSRTSPDRASLGRGPGLPSWSRSDHSPDLGWGMAVGKGWVVWSARSDSPSLDYSVSTCFLEASSPIPPLGRAQKWGNWRWVSDPPGPHEKWLLGNKRAHGHDSDTGKPQAYSEQGPDGDTNPWAQPPPPHCINRALGPHPRGLPPKTESGVLTDSSGPLFPSQAVHSASYSLGCSSPVPLLSGKV